MLDLLLKDVGEFAFFVLNLGDVLICQSRQSICLPWAIGDPTTSVATSMGNVDIDLGALGPAKQ